MNLGNHDFLGAFFHDPVSQSNALGNPADFPTVFERPTSVWKKGNHRDMVGLCSKSLDDNLGARSHVSLRERLTWGVEKELIHSRCLDHGPK